MAARASLASLLCLLYSLGASSSSVLVTGGAGFIGYHSALRLKESNYDVIVLDNFNEEYDVNIKRVRASELKQKGVIVYESTATDGHIIDYIFKHNPKLTAVIHCAGIHGNNNDPLNGADNNIKPMVTILDTISRYKNVVLVYMSSYGVYGNGTPPFSVEDTTLDPLDLLATFKYGMEQIAAGYSHDYSIKSIGLRLFTVYGPWSSPGTVVYDMAQSMHNNVPVSLHDSPLVRDFVYIDDVVDSIELALKYRFTDKVKHKIFNIATGKGTPLTTVAKLLKEELGMTSLLQESVSTSSDTPVKVFGDITDTKSDLKFTPKIDIKTGIGKFVKWWKVYISNIPYSNEQFDTSLKTKAFDEYIEDRSNSFRERLADLRENYTSYALANNIPVAKYYRHKTYKFIENIDASGTIRRESNTTFEHMKKICDIIASCVAFNTKGEIKDIHLLKKKMKGNGLYVAEVDVCQAGLHSCFPPLKCVYKGPSEFDCICDDNYESIQDKCIERYTPNRESATEADLKINDRLNGVDINQFTVDPNERFVHYQSKDTEGGELLYVPNAKGDMSVLAKACQATYHCVGFTTDGILKQSIGTLKNSKYHTYVLEHVAKEL